MVVGMMMLVSGLVSHLLYRDYLNFFNHSTVNIPVLLFFLGAITCTLAMLGLGGVCLNSLPLLTASISLILLLVTVEVVAGLLSYYYLDTLAVFLHHQLLEGLKVFNHPEYRGVT